MSTEGCPLARCPWLSTLAWCGLGRWRPARLTDAGARRAHRRRARPSRRTPRRGRGPRPDGCPARTRGRTHRRSLGRPRGERGGDGGPPEPAPLVPGVDDDAAEPAARILLVDGPHEEPHHGVLLADCERAPEGLAGAQGQVVGRAGDEPGLLRGDGQGGHGHPVGRVDRDQSHASTCRGPVARMGCVPHPLRWLSR